MANYIGRLVTTGVVERGGIGIRLAKEVIESTADQLNGERALPLNIDHNPLCMPVGKIGKAWVESFGNEYAVMAHIHVEENARDAVHIKSGTELVVLGFTEEPRPFFRAFKDVGENQVKVSVDLANFDSPENHATFVDAVKNIDDEIACGNIGRYAAEPNPLIQLILSHSAIGAALGIGLWTFRRAEKFVRYTIDETLRKIADDLSESLSRKIKQIVKAYQNRRSDDDRRVLVEVVVPGDMNLVLLVEITHDEDFPAINLDKLTAEMEKYGDLLQQAEEAVFARTEAGEWEFQYLTTRKGQVLGTVKCYKRTTKICRRIGKGLGSDDG